MNKMWIRTKFQSEHSSKIWKNRNVNKIQNSKKTTKNREQTPENCHKKTQRNRKHLENRKKALLVGWLIARAATCVHYTRTRKAIYRISPYLTRYVDESGDSYLALTRPLRVDMRVQNILKSLPGRPNSSIRVVFFIYFYLFSFSFFACSFLFLSLFCFISFHFKKNWTYFHCCANLKYVQIFEFV
jgi:hypothetical protein